MPNNYLSVLYKHIIQVENKNVGLKQKSGGAHALLAPPPRFLRQIGGEGGVQISWPQRFSAIRPVGKDIPHAYIYHVEYGPDN